MLLEVLILSFAFVIAYFFIIIPSIKLFNIKESKNKANGSGISNSVVFNIKTKQSEAQQISTSD